VNFVQKRKIIVHRSIVCAGYAELSTNRISKTAVAAPRQSAAILSVLRH
jgi:hypothetical protein